MVMRCFYSNLSSWVIGLVLFPCILHSQHIQCGHTIVQNHLAQSYPGYAVAIDKSYNQSIANTVFKSNEVYTINVVVHIVYKEDDQNVSDELVHNQIDILNADFRMMNANLPNVRPIFSAFIGDSRIEFKLAEEDPDGNPTTGITRTITNKETFFNFDIQNILDAIISCGIDPSAPELTPEEEQCFSDALGLDNGSNDFGLNEVKHSATGGIDAWDTEKYLNIWVCNLEVNFNGASGPILLGFAYPPSDAPNWPDGILPDFIKANDGVVVHSYAFGSNNPYAGVLAGLKDRGQTCTHEVGHYLGLRHIWGDGDCNMDDGLEDTPTASSATEPESTVGSNCSLSTKDSCPNDQYPDMVENFMDYSNDNCLSFFTTQQIAIMRNSLENSRKGILVDNLSSAVEEIEDYDFDIFPNPASDILYIESANDVQQVQLLDIQGRLIFTGKETESINLSGYPSGLYYVRLRSDQQITTRKIQIIH